MWSGGIDSTYSAAKLLNETDHNVYLHHIYLQNVENRARHEAKAIKALGDKLNKIRPFKFTHNTIDDSYMPTMVYDMARVCFEAGAVSKGWYHYNGTILHKWTIGTHDTDGPSPPDGPIGHNWTRWSVIKHATRAAEYTDPRHLHPSEKPREQFIEFELLPVVSKKEEIRYLKELNLLDDCWYCRTPKEGPCGVCKTCEEVKQALN